MAMKMTGSGFERMDWYIFVDGALQCNATGTGDGLKKLLLLWEEV